MKQILATAALGVLLSACQVVGPDYRLPDKAAMNRGDLQGQLAGEGANVVSAPVPADWWKLYNDPRLDELVRQAMASNTDLRVAAANLQRARYQVQEAESVGGWSAGAKAEAQRLQESGEAFLLGKSPGGQHRQRGDHHLVSIRSVRHLAARHRKRPGQRRRNPGRGRYCADHPGRRCGAFVHASLRGQRRAGDRQRIPRLASPEHDVDPAPARRRARR